MCSTVETGINSIYVQKWIYIFICQAFSEGGKSAQSVVELGLAFVVARLTFSVPSALNSFGIILCFGAGAGGRAGFLNLCAILSFRHSLCTCTSENVSL